MGALTVTIRKRDAWGSFNVRLADLLWSSTYATGGETYTFKNFELAQEVTAMMFLSEFAGFGFTHDRANRKVLAWDLSVAGGAATAGTDALSIKAGVLSRETAGTAHAPMREAPNGVNLSGVLTAVPVLVIGF